MIELPLFIDQLYSDKCVIANRVSNTTIEIAVINGSPEETTEIAEHIIKCVNLFPKLIAMLDFFVLDSDWDLDPILKDKLNEAHKLLRRAKDD